MPLDASSLPVVLDSLECSGTVVAVIDAGAAGFPFLDVNAPFERFTGDSRERIVGRPFRSVAWPGADTLPAIEAALRRNTAYRGALRCIDVSGRERRLGLQLIPDQSAGAGERRTHVLVGRDITDEHRKNEDRETVQRLLLRSFMMTDRPLAILLDDRIVLANARLGTLLDLAPDELIGRSVLEFIAGHAHGAVAAARAGAAAPGVACDVPAPLGPAGGDAPVQLLRFVRIDDDAFARHSIFTVATAPAALAAPAAETLSPPPPAQPRRPAAVPVHIADTMKEAGTYIRLSAGTSADLAPAEQVELLEKTLTASAHPLVLAEVAVPETGARPWAETYLEAVINLPEKLRRRLIPIFGSTGTAALPQTTIQRMSPHCAGLGLRVDALGAPQFNIAAWRPAVLAIDAARCEDAHRLSSFTNLVHSYRAQLLVCGVPGPDQAAAYARRGADILTLA